MKTFRQFLRSLYPPDLPYLDEVFLSKDGATGECLHEGKLVNGRFKNNIRIDRATHLLSGAQHAHVYGRKGEEIGVLNFDATKSHRGNTFRLHQKDAEALRQLGVPVPDNNIIEWILFDVVPGGLLLE